jgi:NRAMP (natural resistance-associated macrophage protein)-like metal ion transporter
VKIIPSTRTSPPAENETARILKSLGPGLITGAADDDPSGITTYSQAGAQFGFQMLWTMVLTYPLMTAVQLVAAEIGRVTGRGLAANIKRVFPVWVLAPLVLALVVANTINIAADVAAMGQAAVLILPGSAPDIVYTVGFGLVSLLLQILMPYNSYVRVLKWLTLALLAYVGVVFTVKIDWGAVARHTAWPQFKLDAKSMTMIVAIFGTTISPYLFFWQASEEVEEIEAHAETHALRVAPKEALRALRGLRIDTAIGMLFSNLVAYFIILTTAVTLNAHGVDKIDTAAQAAEALKPIAGPLAFALFSAGIIGTGLLAVPVLAGSAAYAVAECFGWREGLARKPQEAVGFYAVVAVATIGGVGLNFLHVDPIKALFWSAVVNGVVSAPIMVVMMLLAARPSIMGRFTISPALRILGWLATAVMAAAAVGMFVM